MTIAFSHLKGSRTLTTFLTLAFVVIGLSGCASETETEPAEPEGTAQTEAPPAGAEEAPPAGGDQATVEGTIQALQGGVTSLAPATAVQNIQSWQSQLENAGDPALSEIAGNLGELNSMLQEQPIDGQAVGDLLSELGEQTTSAASNAQGDMTSQLEQLGTTLSEAGSNLSGM